jgi:hypothetical protein
MDNGELPPGATDAAVAAPATTTPGTDVVGDVQNAQNVQNMDDFMRREDKLFGAYPELALKEMRLRQNGMSAEEAYKALAQEYESRGFLPLGKMTPEQQEVREKVLQNHAAGGGGK